MSVTALDEFELELILPSATSRAYIGPLWAPLECEAPIIPAEVERRSELSVNALGCLRGAVFGLCIEAAAGLCLYGIWQLWHIL